MSIRNDLNNSDILNKTVIDFIKKKTTTVVAPAKTKHLNRFDLATAEGGTLRELDELSKSSSVYYANRRKCFGNECNWIVITINAGMTADDRENSNFLIGLVSTGVYYSFGTVENDEVCGQFEYKSAGFSSQFDSDQFATSSDMLHLTALALKSAIMSAFGITTKNIVVCVANKVYCKASYFDQAIKYSGFSDQFSDQFYKGE